ncbi:MAG: ABC transporter permease [Clostridia bacterium]|nr:ABC transporter permease [Clostridia bacterium]
MKASFQRIITLTKRNVIEIIRDPLSLIFLMGMPLVMEILFYFIFHDLTQQFEMKYLAPGIVVFSQAFLSLFAGMLIALDRSSSFLTRLYVTTTKSYEFIASYLLALLPIALIQSIVFFIVGGILDTRLFGVSMLTSILLSIVTSLLFIGIGILIGSLCNEKSVGGVASIVIAGQSVLSGMWFPIEGLNKGMVTFMKCLPFKNATDLMQHTLNGISNPFSDFGLPLIILLAYTALVFIVAIIVFRSKMKSK